MGRPGMAGKWQNPATQGGGCRRVRPISGRLVTVGHEVLWRWSSGGGAPPWPVRV